MERSGKRKGLTKSLKVTVSISVSLGVSSILSIDYEEITQKSLEEFTSAQQQTRANQTR